MRTISLGVSGLKVPTIAVGCMRLTGLDKHDAEAFLKTSIELGANFFDHADIYGGGQCESFFADSVGMNAAVRESMIIQSKCGITKGTDGTPMFDFSKQHIIDSVDGTLKRLRTDYLDVLLLHRPDALMDPEEVAEAFDALHTAGKVRHFGVSNQTPNQIKLLKKFVRQPLVANQLQLSITNATMITRGLNVNVLNESAVDRDGGVLDYCRLEDITIQPWSTFQYGFFEGVFLDNPKFPELNRVVNKVAAAHGVSNTCIVMAWLLRHPAKMQPITGTMNRTRLADCIKAADITLSREEWYAILQSAGNILL